MKAAATAGVVIAAVLVGATAGYIAGTANGRGYIAGTANGRTTTSISSTTTTRTLTTSVVSTAYASVEILSIQLANSSVGSALVVNATFKNTGDVPIFYCANCGLVWTIDPSNATQRVAVQCYPMEGGALIEPLNPGFASSVFSSQCYKYCTPDNSSCQFVADKFIRAETIRIGIVLTWGTNSTVNNVFNSTSSQTFVIHA